MPYITIEFVEINAEEIKKCFSGWFFNGILLNVSESIKEDEIKYFFKTLTEVTQLQKIYKIKFITTRTIYELGALDYEYIYINGLEKDFILSFRCDD